MSSHVQGRNEPASEMNAFNMFLSNAEDNLHAAVPLRKEHYFLIFVYFDGVKSPPENAPPLSALPPDCYYARGSPCHARQVHFYTAEGLLVLQIGDNTSCHGSEPSS